MSLRLRSFFVNNNCFFVTTTTYRRMRLFTRPECCRIILESLEFYCKEYQAAIISYCIMPDHIHFVVFFEGPSRCSDFVRDFKKYTSSRLRIIAQESAAPEFALMRYEKGVQHFKVWADRFHAIVIRHRQVLLNKIRYIHENPLKWNLAEAEWEYPWSSAAWYWSKPYTGIALRHVYDIS